MLLDCPFVHGLLDLSCICKTLVLQILLPSVLVYLHAAPVLGENRSSLLMSYEKNPTSLSSICRTVSKARPGRRMLTSYLTALGLKSTILALCIMDLELLCCSDLCSNKGSGFIFSASTSCAMGLEELLMLLMMFTKALRDPLLTFPALKTYSDTFWKSTLLSPEAVALSFPVNLLSSSRTLYSVLAAELKNLGL